MTLSAENTAGRSDFLLLTCEHGGNDIPHDYAHLFHDAQQALCTHRGYDIGALGVARCMSSRLSAPIVFSTTSRLLIDLNRSLDSGSLLSEFSQRMDEQERGRLIDEVYRPYRKNVTRLVEVAIQAGHRVVHVGIHSFTDVLDGQTRELDIALLFDEARPMEQDFCHRWQSAMLARSAGFRYRFNEPYRGSDDGLTTTLRQHFPASDYLGLEVELRQGLLGTIAAQTQLGEHLATSLAATLR